MSRILTVITVTTMLVAPAVSLVAAMLLGLRDGYRADRWSRRYWSLATLVVVAAFAVPSSRLPFRGSPADVASNTNILSGSGVRNVEAAASWRLSNAVPMAEPAERRFRTDSGRLRGSATCAVLGAAGRMFQVAPMPRGVAHVTATAQVSSVDAAVQAIALRVAEHGGEGSETLYDASLLPTVISHSHVFPASASEGRVVMSIWNRSDRRIRVCVDAFGLVEGDTAALVASPIALAASRPSGATSRIASSLHVMLAGIVFWFGIWGWHRAWACSPRLVQRSLLVHVVVVPSVWIAAGPFDLAWLVEALPHRNFVAVQLLVAGLVLLAANQVGHRRVPVIAGLIVAVLALDARAAGLGLGAAAATFLGRRVTAIGSAGSVIALGLAAWWRRDDVGALTGLDDARVRVFRAAWSAITDQPWTGHGFSRSRDVLRMTMPDDPIAFGHAHNVFLEVGIQAGLVALILVFLAFVAAMVVAYRRSTLLGGAFLVLFVTSLADVTLLAPPGLVPCLLLAGRLVRDGGNMVRSGLQVTKATTAR